MSPPTQTILGFYDFFLKLSEGFSSQFPLEIFRSFGFEKFWWKFISSTDILCKYER